MGTTDPSTPSPPAAARPTLAQRLAPWGGPFVWAVWGAMALALPAFVWRFSDNVPIADDWELVPTLTGARPATAAWLWEQYNEHRIPIPKLLHLALAALTGYRAGMYFNCAALSAVAALLILAARRVRGRTSFVDVFFPLALMHWGQSQNLLWGFQVQFVSSAALSGVLLALIVSPRQRLSVGSAALAGPCLLALPLTGANGLALVPPLALWLGYAGLVAWRSPGPGARPAALVALGATAAALALLALYFVNYHEVARHEGAPSLHAVVDTAGRFLAMSIGPAGTRGWPLPGMLLLTATLLGAAVLLRTAVRRPAERLRATGLFCFLGATGSLALAFGWGRAAQSQDAAWVAQNTRYVTLAAPLLCCLFFAGRLYAGRGVPWLLCGLMAVLLVGNTLHGLEHGRKRALLMEMVAADVRAGKTPEELGKKYARAIFVETAPDVLAQRFEMLRRARQGPYKHLPPE